VAVAAPNCTGNFYFDQQHPPADFFAETIAGIDFFFKLLM
jgi:hypothetical protein